ncbi:hypothetical protein EXIGLDRAFT_728328 [Exidia glandulosa HHB12029]|uniref:F-box domain-containing protein n=1 Tax=Exidia glandulosa HHB12029 TaxID=1314781 RepID=A0A165LTM0_EXIGL|nr:hypothetical protein EXIGLDRAFT_728328 [Exidia glandulosa HHB12029]
MQRLPNELWASVFALFDLSDLTIVSQVAAHWRAVAFDQPQFWRYILVQSTSPESLYWTSRKVAASLQRKVSLEVVITDEQAPVVDEIFGYVEVTLSRCYGLRLELPRSYWGRLSDILVQPAPALEHFALKLLLSDDDGVEEPSLPADLFRGSSTSLREVHLHGVALPVTSATAFQHVDTVDLSVPDASWQEFDLRLFDVFPSTRALTLFGGGLRVPQPLPDRVVDAFTRLELLYVQYYETENLVVFSQLPSAVVPEVSVAHSDIGTVYAALDQLSGPIRLAIIDLPLAVHVTFSSAETGFWRTFEEAQSDFIPGAYNAVAILEDHIILERVYLLRVSLSLWDIVSPFIPPDNVIAELMLFFDSKSESTALVALPTLPLKCPALHTLVLQASKDNIVSVAASDIITFVDLVNSGMVNLELHRVLPQGNREGLIARFASFEETMNILV